MNQKRNVSQLMTSRRNANKSQENSIHKPDVGKNWSEIHNINEQNEYLKEEIVFSRLKKGKRSKVFEVE